MIESLSFRIPFTWLIYAIAFSCLYGQDNELVIGHAHNDYEQENPLFEALENGFKSIEVDIHYRKGKLIVSHTRSNLSKKPTLEELYLSSLDSLIRSGGLVDYLEKSEQLTLMIDLKTRKKKLLKRLNALLTDYDHLLQKRTKDGEVRWGPIVILISGNPPIGKWKKIKSPYFYLDGRIGKNYPKELEGQVYRISASLKKVISVKHLLDKKCKQYREFIDLVKNIYARGHKEVRFWASPDETDIWESLIEAGVNVVSVDQLSKFNSFMQSR